MTWTAPPPTCLDGVGVTAGHLNAIMANLLETDPAKATAGL